LPDGCRKLPVRGGFFSPSLDGGLPLLPLFSPTWRSNSAIRFSQRRHLRRMAHLQRQHQLNQVTFRELVEGGAIHQILESTTRRCVKRNLGQHRRHSLIRRASPCADPDAARRHLPGQ
jgi:hypothetical protein